MRIGLDWQIDPANNGTANARLLALTDILAAAPSRPLTMVRASLQLIRYAEFPGVYPERASRIGSLAASAASRGLYMIFVLSPGPPASTDSVAGNAAWKALGGSAGDWNAYDAEGHDDYRVIPNNTAVKQAVLNAMIDGATAVIEQYQAVGLNPAQYIRFALFNEMGANLALTEAQHAQLDWFAPRVKEAFPSYELWAHGLNSPFDGELSRNRMIDSLFAGGHTWPSYMDGFPFHCYPYAVENTKCEIQNHVQTQLQATIARYRLYTNKPLGITEWGIEPQACQMTWNGVTRAFAPDSMLLGRQRRTTFDTLTTIGSELAFVINYTGISQEQGWCTHIAADNTYYRRAIPMFNAHGITAYDTNPPSGTYDANDSSTP